VEKHYVETSLQPLDQSLHSLNDTGKRWTCAVDNIHFKIAAVEPRLQDPVVVHVTRNIGEIMLENGLTLALEKGDIYITQYRFIQSHLLEGQIELI
jgi:hypothetical protein